MNLEVNEILTSPYEYSDKASVILYIHGRARVKDISTQERENSFHARTRVKNGDGWVRRDKKEVGT